VAGRVFVGWTHVEDDDLARGGPAKQLVAGDLLDAAAQVGVPGRAHLGEQRRGGIADPREQPGYVVAGQRVEDAGALLARGDQPRLVKYLQVGRAAAQAQASLAGEILHAALALREQVHQLQPLRAGQRLADAGELLIQLGLALVGTHRRSCRAWRASAQHGLPARKRRRYSKNPWI